ncbi:hypothetical protein [Peribacillus frigoritolerans]|uniref:hypothetical protein n=1 Tax=Peribacillus frigoritolerans TaxID=450367 RepID=UPI0039A272C5
MIRLTPVALFTSFQEVYETVQVLKKVMDGNLYETMKIKGESLPRMGATYGEK